MCAKSHTLYRIARCDLAKTSVFPRKQGNSDRKTTEIRLKIAKIQTPSKNFKTRLPCFLPPSAWHQCGDASILELCTTLIEIEEENGGDRS
jgi:hypothetical protein